MPDALATPDAGGKSVQLAIRFDADLLAGLQAFAAATLDAEGRPLTCSAAVRVLLTRALRSSAGARAGAAKTNAKGRVK
jgi:hypothetical protein